MNSNSKATSRRSKNSRIQAGQTSLVPATAGAADADGQHPQNQFDDLFKRLQLREFELEEQDWIIGGRTGFCWADENATVAELRRLEHTRSRGRNWYFGNTSSTYSDAERFYFIIRPDFEGDRSAAAGFWEPLYGDGDLPKIAFVQSFAEAAMKVWDAVKDRFDAENEAI